MPSYAKCAFKGPFFGPKLEMCMLGHVKLGYNYTRFKKM
jgi:hypothetical protein